MNAVTLMYNKSLNVLTDKRFLKIVFLLSVLTLLLIISFDIFASQTPGGGLPFDSWFEKLRKSVTGPFAFAAAIIGIVATGATLIFGGDMNGFMRTIVFIVLVLCFIIAAENLLKNLTGTGAEVTHSTVVQIK